MLLQKEISSLVTDDNNKSTFEEAVAYLSTALNMWIPDDITVARYVTLKKAVIKKIKDGTHSTKGHN